MVLAACRIVKVATLQQYRYLQSCNVPVRKVTIQKFPLGAGSPFQRAALAPRRAQNLLAGRIFDSPAVKSAFALLLARVTEPELEIIQRDNHINIQI